MCIEPRILKRIPDDLKTQKMCKKPMEKVPWLLHYVPVRLRTKKMCDRAVEKCLHPLRFIPDHLKTQKMCEKAVEEDPWRLYTVSDHFKTQEMCNKVVEVGPWQLKDVSDWFVTHELIKIWHKDYNYCTDDKIIEWYKRYEKRKAQKASIKEELLPIALHPSRYWDWRMSEDEKRETEKLWA